MPLGMGRRTGLREVAVLLQSCWSSYRSSDCGDSSAVMVKVPKRFSCSNPMASSACCFYSMTGILIRCPSVVTGRSRVNPKNLLV